MAELALLTERARPLEGRSFDRTGEGDVTITEESTDTAQALLPSMFSATVELTPHMDRHTFEVAEASEDEVETLELESIGPPCATNESGASLASASDSRETASSDGEAAVSEAAPVEDRGTREPPDAAEVDSGWNAAMLLAEAVQPLAVPPEGQLGTGVSSSESAGSPLTPLDPPETADGARQPWRRAVAVVMRGGLLTLLVIGALLAVTRGVPIAPDSEVPETVAPIAPRDLLVPAADEGGPESDDVGTTRRPSALLAAEVERSNPRDLQPEPDLVPERELEPVAHVMPEPAGQPSPTLVTATIRAPGFAGVNLRRAPSTSAATIRVLATGTRVELLGDQVRGDGLGWQQVVVPGGDTGWVVVGTVQP